ncbi:MAG: hypothetical protein V4681_00675 [Patescibacteria group bacterium]
MRVLGAVEERRQALLRNGAHHRAKYIRDTLREKKAENSELQGLRLEFIETELLTNLARLEEIRVARQTGHGRAFEPNAFVINAYGYTGPAICRAVCPFDGKSIMLIVRGHSAIKYEVLGLQACALDAVNLILKLGLLQGWPSNEPPSIRGH